MKKLLALLLAVLMLLSLVACSKSGSTESGAAGENGSGGNSAAAAPTPVQKVKDMLSQSVLAPAVQAEDKAEDQLQEYVETLPNLNKMVNNLQGLFSAKGLSVVMNANGVITDPQTQQDSVISANISVAANLKEKQARLDLTANAPDYLDMPVAATAYVDSTELLVACDAILGQKSLALPLTNLVQDWNNSALSQMIGETLPEDLPLNDILNLPGFEPQDVVDKLEEIYGDDWNNFKASVTLVEKTENKHFTDGGKVCEIKWDNALVETMAAKAEATLQELQNFDLDNPMEAIALLQKHSLSELLAHGVVALLNEFQKADLMVELLMADDETLIGLYIASTDPEQYGGMELRLCGTNNIWDHIVITMFAEGYNDSYDMVKKEQGVDIALTVQGDVLTAVLSMFDAEEGQAHELELLGSLIYNDTTGSISILKGEEVLIAENIIFVKPSAAGVQVTVNAAALAEAVQNMENSDDDYEYEYDDGESSSENPLKELTITVALEPMNNSLSKPTQPETNVLVLNQDELQQLFGEIQQNIQNNFPKLMQMMGG